MRKTWLGILTIAALLSGCSNDFKFDPDATTHVVVDSFTQNENFETLDIIGIIDTSCSMVGAGNIDKVTNGMINLRADIETLTTDYQFGFLTAEANPDFEGPFDSTALDIDLKFAVSMLNEQYAEESGFEALYTYEAYQESFVRKDEDIGLLIFMFSDEDDHSTISAHDMKTWIDYQWPAKVVDIVTVVPAMSNEGYDIKGLDDCGDQGVKYIDLSKQFSKSTVDLCNGNWSKWLGESSFLIETLDHVNLTQEPVPESIVVYVDHEVIYTWSYDNEFNVVWLDEVPAYGSLVEVGYQVLSN